MRLPGMNGLDVLKKIKESDPSLPVIILTAFGDIKTAVECMKQGAHDFITKPFDEEFLQLIFPKTELTMK